MALDPELKELLEQAKAAIGSHKDLQKKIDEILVWGADKGRLAEAEKAVKQVNDAVKEIAANFEKKLAAVSRQIYDAAGRYHGRAFATEEQARTFALAALRGVAEYRGKAVEMLNADHKEFVERLAHAGEDSMVGHEHYGRIQRLTEEYGLFGRLAFRMPMSEATGTFHRRKSGLRARKTKVRTRVNEQAAGWEPINLTAEDFDILVSYPISLDEDMLVSFAELLAGEMALGFAIALDEDGFIGDASDNYDNIMGITPRLIAINGVNDGGGLVLASGAAGTGWAGIAHDDVLKLIGQARYIRPGFGQLICSNEFFWQVLAKFVKASGGRTQMETQAGPRFQFEGTQVEITPVMPRATGNSQIPLLYGDVNLSSTIGDRRQLTIRESREVRFESKEVVMLASGRFDINNHTLGDTDTPGPVVGLITAVAA